MKYITTDILIHELRKYGTLFIGRASFGFVPDEQFFTVFSFTKIEQESNNFGNFLRMCANCCDEGFNPVFDIIIKQSK